MSAEMGIRLGKLFLAIREQLKASDSPVQQNEMYALVAVADFWENYFFHQDRLSAKDNVSLTTIKTPEIVSREVSTAQKRTGSHDVQAVAVATPAGLKWCVMHSASLGMVPFANAQPVMSLLRNTETKNSVIVSSKKNKET